MAEYIEREAALLMLTYHPLTDPDPLDLIPAVLRTARKAVAKISAADVVEVVHGKWVDHCVRDWRCSVCGEKINKVRNVDGYCYEDKPHYCPNCGARMDGDNP